MADLAAAVAGGGDNARAVLTPILPVLYHYVARRTRDLEEAEDLLVEALLHARARAQARAADRSPLLPWLLGIVNERLLDGEYDPLLEAGLRPNGYVPRVEKPPWLVENSERLPRLERLALGMRVGDGLGAETIGAVLGADADTVKRSVEAAVDALQASCCPDKRPYRTRPDELDRYISDLEAGQVPDPPPGFGEGTVTVLHALVATRKTARLTPAQEGRLWRRYAEEREEYLPGVPLPTGPRWVRPALLLLLGALALLGAAVWFAPRLQGRAGRSGEAAAAPAPTAAPATQPSSEPTRPPAVASGPMEGLSGTLYHVERGGWGVRLVATDLDEAGPTGTVEPRTVLSAPQERLVYAISPTGARLVYSTGDSLWLSGLDAGWQKHLLTVNPRNGGAASRRASRGPALQVGALAWHPHGRAIALVAEPRGPSAQQPSRVLLLDLDSRARRTLLQAEPGERVREVSWSPSGERALVLTDAHTYVLEPGRGRAGTRKYPATRRVTWAPGAGPERVLVLGDSEVRDPGGAGWFGVYGVEDETGGGVAGRAAHAGWHPDGRRVVVAGMADERGGRGWALQSPEGRPEGPRVEALPGAPGMDADAREVEFAPGGPHVAYLKGDKLYVAEYTTGRERLLGQVPRASEAFHWQQSRRSYQAPTPAPGEKGAILYVEPSPHPFTMRARLVRLDLGTGRRTELLEAGRIEQSAEPFGGRVAVAADASLLLLDPAMGEIRPLVEAGRGRVFSPGWSPGGSSVWYLREEGTPRAGGRTIVERYDLHSRHSWRVFADDGTRGLRSVRPSPSGLWLLLEGRRDWWLLPATGGGPRPLPHADRYHWSPDSGPERLLRVEPGGAGVVLADVRGRELSEVSGESGLDARWLSSDVALLLDARRGLRTRSTNGRGGRSLGVLPPWDASLELTPWDSRPDWSGELTGLSPSGRRLLSSDGLNLWSVDTRTGRRVWLASEDYGITRPIWLPLSVMYPLPVPVSEARPLGDDRPLLHFVAAGDRRDGARSGFEVLHTLDPRTGRTVAVGPVSGYDVRRDDGELLYLDRAGLWRLDQRAGEVRHLVAFEDGVSYPYTRLGDPRWSPGGLAASFLVLPRDTAHYTYSELAHGLHIVDARSGKRRTSLRVSEGDPWARSSQWAPDGEAVMLASPRVATLFDLEREKLGEIRAEGHGFPLLSPLPGDRSVLCLDLDPRERAGRLMMRRWGGGARVLSRRAHSPLWAPDGRSVLYFEGDGIWQSSRDGAVRRVVTPRAPGGRDAASPAWAPGGQLSYATGSEVWTVNVDTGAARRVLAWQAPVSNVKWGRW